MDDWVDLCHLSLLENMQYMADGNLNRAENVHFIFFRNWAQDLQVQYPAQHTIKIWITYVKYRTWSIETHYQNININQ